MQPTPETITALKRLYKYPTTAIRTDQRTACHELFWHRAIIALERAECQSGYVVVKLGASKKSLRLLRMWVRMGTIDLR